MAQLTFQIAPSKRGEIVIDTLKIENDAIHDFELGTYEIVSRAFKGYGFIRWESEGSVIVEESEQEATKITITGDGVLRMVMTIGFAPKESPRAEKWRISQRVDLSSPRQEALKEIRAEQVKEAFWSIDRKYEEAKEILDVHGILANTRTFYRAFVEELWKVSNTYTSLALSKACLVVISKYTELGGDYEILTEIAKLFPCFEGSY